MKAGKVVVIGIDGGTFDIIQPLVEKGKLPVLERCMRDGAWGVLRSTIPSITMPAWPSMLTGVNAARHGLFYFRENTHTDYDDGEFRSASDYKAKCLWDFLGEHDRKVLFTAVPTTYPPPPVNGVMLSAIRPLKREQFKVQPPELEPEIRRLLRLEKDRIESFHSILSLSGRRRFYERIRREHNTAVEKLTGLNLHLMKRHDWSLLMTVYMSTDVVQHFCWGVMDPDHPRHDPDLAEQFGDIIPEIYAKVDEGIGRIIEAAGENATVMIVSDHGAGPIHKKFEINRWLFEEGLLFLKHLHPYRWGLTQAPLRAIIEQIGLGRLIRRIPEVLLEWRIPVWGREEIPISRAVDWQKTQAYATDNGINVNLMNREHQGIVPQRDYQKLVAELKARLQNFREPITGKTYIKAVYSRDEIYSGPFIEDACDLYIVPDKTTVFGKSLNRGRIIEKLGADFATGGHLNRPNGIFILKNPLGRRGVELEAHSLLDVLPTLLYMLEIPIPDYMEGAVIREALNPDHLAVLPIRYGAGDESGSQAADGLTRDDQKAFKTQLEQLGYL